MGTWEFGQIFEKTSLYVLGALSSFFILVSCDPDRFA